MLYKDNNNIVFNINNINEWGMFDIDWSIACVVTV